MEDQDQEGTFEQGLSPNGLRNHWEATFDETPFMAT